MKAITLYRGAPQSHERGVGGVCGGTRAGRGFPLIVNHHPTRVSDRSVTRALRMGAGLGSLRFNQVRRDRPTA